MAQLVGSPPINFLSASGNGENQVELPFLGAPVPTPGVANGQPVTLGLRPHDISLMEDTAGTGAGFDAIIRLTDPLGDVTVIDVAANGAERKMVLREEVAVKYKVGDDVKIGFNPKNLHIFDSSSGVRMGGSKTQ